ncbi:MAG TPA: UTP--glucose-1-phosphate uridylyltransferase [Thermoplasmata archaeon]|nr:UTP--glucose-1-phosphate uridylyltransferase [Thermoplasmata archaeon]
MKALIPAAGLGTRFLPYTKSTPKEMLPLLDKPAIQYVVEEAVASGYRDILLVTGRHKRSIEDHFDRSAELEQYLSDRGNESALEKVRAVSRLANLLYVRQKEPRGLGDAILAGQDYLDAEPFGLLLGDDVCIASEPCQRQVAELFEKRSASVIAVQEAPEHQLSKYGVVSGEWEQPGILKVRAIQEKPSPSQASSNLVIIGRYHFTEGILSAIRDEARDDKKEVGLTPAINRLLTREDVFAVRFPGKRYDIGDKAGWLFANLELGLTNPEFSPSLIARYPALDTQSPL